ncbi:flavin reductase family protein [Arthrobacter sp. APC 3897]|uniref:flavin reductase family protein n=1 Tax=Arthrobacter sp. APC 3897 TaxID=3035204 RepID=UPI0025B3DAB4|nr:flavin reductase family protein [Arthrobacter sp. APC 3897]MDN3482419.1 flavin reductase family protein [Arthrobacter sp. APC 3897]
MEHGVFPGELVPSPEVTDEAIDSYRLLSADIASGVAVVSTRLRGRDYAATVSGFLSVSYDPPTLLVSLYADSRIAEAVLDSGTWALSLLSARQRGTANWLASPGSPLEGLLSQVDYGRGPATGAAVIEGCIAWFEVRTTQVTAAATHQLVVGEVLAMGRRATAGDEADPLVHFASAYGRLA